MGLKMTLDDCHMAEIPGDHSACFKGLFHVWLQMTLDDCHMAESAGDCSACFKGLFHMLLTAHDRQMAAATP